jgi:Bacterial PH domain/Short C-terminal domain/Protein of unknown function (DUF2510)
MQNATPPNWYADPTGRHQLRYWNGYTCTEHVSDAGRQSTDPVEAPTEIQVALPQKRETFKEGFQRRQAEAKAKVTAKQAARQEEAAATTEERIAAGARRDVEEAKAKMRVRFGAGREIKKLPDHLWHDETVELLSSGTVGEKNGLLALTSHRLIFLFSGLMNAAFEDFPISNISSISYKSGMLMASIEVYASSNKAIITNVNKLDAKEIADAIRARLGRPAAATSVQAVASDADELAKWAALRDSGVITAEDFEAKKRQLLGY